jgi:hypothetical protein
MMLTPMLSMICQASGAALPKAEHLHEPTRSMRGYQARSPQRVPVLFRDRVSGSVILDGNPSQWKPVALMTDWLSDDGHLNRFSSGEWQFGEVNLSAFVHCGFNSKRVHTTDDTLQR